MHAPLLVLQPQGAYTAFVDVFRPNASAKYLPQMPQHNTTLRQLGSIKQRLGSRR